MRRVSGCAAAAGVLVAGVLVLLPVGGATAADLGDGGRFDTWAGYQVGRFPVEALAGDFNGDGAPDVAWVRNDFFENTLSVTYNLGDGTMSDPRNFPTSAGSATDGVATDLDGDGNLDVAVVAEGACLCNDIIDLYLGDGTGDFVQTTATGGEAPHGIAAGDLDADGDQDLAVTNYWSEDGTVSVLLNNGDATFEAEDIYQVGTRPNGIVMSDIDGDDDLDVVAAAAGFSGTELALYPLENAGDGTLTEAAPQEINQQMGDPVLAAGDLDGDGDEDLALAGIGTDNHFFLFNNGAGSYTPTTNSTGGFSSGDLEVIDLEPDGDLDVVSATFGSSQAGDITVFRNAGGGTFTAERLDSSQQPMGLAVADFTRDGINDVAAANRGTSLGIIHAGGSGGVFPIPQQTTFFQPPFKITTGDLDGDGDIDIAATTTQGSFGGDIQVLLNDGTGTMVEGPLIEAGGPPESIDAADFDLDGDDDLVWELFGFSFDDAGVALSNGDGTFSAPQLLNVTACGPGQLSAADMDGDGDPDILIPNEDSASFGTGCNVADSVTIVPSNGDGTFGATVEVETESIPRMAIGADMDGDGLNDVVTAHSSGNGGDIAVALNNGGGSFEPHVEIDSGQSHFEVAAADLDADGDIDLATVDQEDSATVFTNDGSGTAFTFEQLAGADISGFTNAIAVDIGDIDNDGRPDVVVANWTGNDIGVWFNNGNGTFQRDAIHYGVNTGLSDLELADFDGDGLLDVAVPNTTSFGFAPAGEPVAVDAAAPNGVSVVLNGGSGTQPPDCTIRGTAGNDTLTGTSGADVICGGAGNDTIRGGGGDDIILGGAGSDRLSGDSGADGIFGGDGQDGLLGGPGGDRLNGGGGKDRCDGASGTDTGVNCERSAGIP
ncbi:MAG: VCBS repeat-containing protein [Geodermatophilaceae bacterium]|nr:VCBS repeat-containing protein [Geodermatophilaceae bacterium]